MDRWKRDDLHREMIDKLIPMTENDEEDNRSMLDIDKWMDKCRWFI